MNSKSEVFTVSLKMAGKDMKLVININESFDQVFQNLKSINPHCNHKKVEILEKLTTTLKQQLKKQSLSSNLAQSITLFLSKNQKIQRKEPLTIPQALASNNKEQVNVIKIEQVKSNRKDQRAINEKQTTIIKRISSKQNHSSTSGKKFSMPSCLKRQGHSNKQSKRVNSFTQSSQKQKRCNPDLIKACQIIMKKAQDNDMKQMAKQYLKQKGILKQEKKTQNIIHQISNIQIKPQTINSNIQPQTQINLQSTQQVHDANPIRIAKILNQSNESTTRRQYSRFNKFKYLQSSFVNESLSKEYDSYTLQNNSLIRSKRYTYL